MPPASVGSSVPAPAATASWLAVSKRVSAARASASASARIGRSAAMIAAAPGRSRASFAAASLQSRSRRCITVQGSPPASRILLPSCRSASEKSRRGFWSCTPVASKMARLRRA
ncbi:MAG: hypothetical protein KIS96_14485 [Bauldia sp.]|nr:hypothetical protein [Bauldia sp.]